MAEERWEKAKVIFEGVLNQEPEKRQQYLVEACGEDKILLAEVESLLASLARAEDFMESSAIEKVAELIVTTEQMDQDLRPNPEEAGQLEETRPNLIGTTVKERYLIEKQLDKGGFGTVYLARDLQIVSRPVVIKILHRDRLSDSWVVNKFRHEIEALARINHPGIVGILDTGELQDGVPFIVMQFVDGVTLRELMKPEGMDYERAAHIIKEISHALEEVHSKNIFHRDLKPENIMIRKLAGGQEQVTLIDFGIAKVKDSVLAPSTITKGSAGTVAYMSPEQLTAQPVAAPSDIYSLGMIFYEMLSGRRPFNFESIGHLFHMQQTGVKLMPVDLRPSIPLPAQAIILKSLLFDPKDRYQNVRQFGDELAAALLNKEKSGETSSLTGVDPGKFPTDDSAGILTTEVSPPSSAKFDLPSITSDSVPTSGFWRRNRIIMSLAALPVFFLSAIAIWMGLSYYPVNRNSTANPVSTSVNPTTSQTIADVSPTRELTFSLTVQKMNNSQPLGQPFESIGEEVFASGWKFRLNLVSSDSGFLYIIDEGQNQKGENAFFVLFPTPKNNNGSARIESQQKLQTLWNVFDANPGKEKIWFIWTAQKNSELERIAADSVKNGFAVIDLSQIDFLRQMCNLERAGQTQLKKDSRNSSAVIKGNGEVIVNFVELAHKPY